MTTIYVTYSGSPSDRFDKEYYVTKHLPLVHDAWDPIGLTGIDAFFPSGSGAGYVAIIAISFRDEAAQQAALTSPQLPTIVADVPNFTALAPAFGRMVPL
jgi:uncharacterized protein (TIGR02118 family)